MKELKKLSRSEMKTFFGGVPEIKSCSCTGCIGSWTYSDTPTGQQVLDDINRYCSTGTADCTS